MFQNSQDNYRHRAPCSTPVAEGLLLPWDVSPYGVGTVLLHNMQDNPEKPTAYVSCTPTPAEHHYSQLDEETLAIILGITKVSKVFIGLPFQYPL